jgi:membrane-associated protease RseP (regulator of RpoE activity)
MRNPAIPLALLAPLMLVSAASRLSASGEPSPTPEKKTEKRAVVDDGKKKIVVDDDKHILVDGDRIVVLDDDLNVDVDPVIVGDLPDFHGDDLPRVVRFHGHRAGGYLGVRSIEMTPELRQHFGAPKDAGVLVGTVEPESPAAKAGIQVGDILTAVDGEEVGSTRELSRSVRRHKAGDAVKVDLLRERAKKTLAVTIQASEGKGGDHEDEIRVGEFGRGPHGFAWRDWERSWRDRDRGDFAIAPDAPPVPPVPAVPNGPRWNGLEDRVNSLEQRLKELEGRLPTPPR